MPKSKKTQTGMSFRGVYDEDERHQDWIVHDSLCLSYSELDENSKEDA
jgi:hypothetical protein